MLSLKLYHFKFFIILSVFIGFIGFSQSPINNSLRRKVSENEKVFNSNIDKAYLEIGILLKTSRAIKDSTSELRLLDRKCRYFYSKNQTDSLLSASEKLQKVAAEYGDLYSVSMGNIYLAEAYSINAFYDKALYHLDVAYRTLEKDKSKNPRIFFAKSNVLNSFANIYSDKGEPRKAVKKIYQAINSYKELSDPEQIKNFQYLNYSNIASLYLLYDIDSANYFAKKSIDLQSPKINDDRVMISNYSVLGKTYKQKKEYVKSLYYYHKSIDLSDKIGEKLNTTSIYKDIVELYKLVGKKDSAIIYENKLKQNEIAELQSKYNSLHEVIDKDQKEDSKSKLINIVLIICISISFFALIIRLVISKRKRTTNDIIEAAPFVALEDYNKLLDLINKNDPAFFFAFEQTFPTFSNALLKINPTLSNSEIEFCAFLKLKLSTKEIAKITLIEPRTVQNKKYRIRKRLNIPTSVNIYNWFDEFNKLTI